MRLRFKIYMVFCLLFCLVSCAKEEENVVTNDVVDQVSIELFTRLRSYDTPVSRMEALENDVAKDPWILVFTDSDGTAANAKYAEAARASISMGNKSYVLLKPQSAKSWILILANPQEKFYVGSTQYDFSIANFDSQLANKTLAQAASLLSAMPLSTGTVVNEPPFGGKTLPMSYVYEATSGINVNTKIGTSTAPLELTRAVAKIVVKSTASDFVLSGIHSIYNLNRNTVLHNLSGTPGAATSWVNYIKSNTTQDFVSASGNLAPPVYLYEATANGSNYTYMIIHASYKGVSGYYKMAVVNNSLDYMDLKRNYEYEFTITSANSPGFGTYADALLSEPNNMDLQYTVAITDISSYEMKANSEYYLAVSNRLSIVYDNTGSSGNQYVAFTLTANCTYADSFTNESNYIRASNSAMTIVSPASGKISSAANSNSPSKIDVVVKFAAGSADDSRIDIKLGNIEQTVFVKRKSILPKAGTVVNFYTTNGSVTDFEYYLLSAEVDATVNVPWLEMSNSRGFVGPDPNSMLVENGIIDINVASTTSARNAVVYLTTIKNPEKPLEDTEDIPRRIKLLLYQSGS